MSTSQHGTAVRPIHTLFSVGAIGGLTDGELLEMFQVQHGEAAELAFAVIVKRHGPMVRNVCQRVLRDPHDADDAFQATFVILVKKASQLNLRDSLGPWLHVVALRVASCAARRTPGDECTSERRVKCGSSMQPAACPMMWVQSSMRRSSDFQNAIELRSSFAGWRDSPPRRRGEDCVVPREQFYRGCRELVNGCGIGSVSAE